MMTRNVLTVLCLVLATFTSIVTAFTPSTSTSCSFVSSSSSTSSTTSTSLFMGSNDAPQGLQKGTVKWFNTMKGFGFIQPDDGSTDVFVHQTSIKMEGFRSLADGEAVEYLVEIDQNGRKKASGILKTWPWIYWP